MSRGLIFPFGGAKQIWRDYTTALSSVLHKPRKAEIRDWGAKVEFELDNLPPGPPGPRGPVGPRGPQGLKGDKGDVGDYYGITVIGSSEDISDLPASANEGDFWGLLGDQTIRLYIWTSGAWFDAGTITAPEAFPVGNTLHVQTNGSNANSGTSWATAVRSIEQAVDIATGMSDPVLIQWAAETAIETQGHIDLPDNCVIKAVHRTVFVHPAAGYESRNVFRLGSGCFIEGVIAEDWVIDDADDPTEGFFASFRPDAVIRRVPYIHKCAMRKTPTWTIVPPPLDRTNANPLVGMGGGMLLADGLVCSQYSTFANIMAWGATPVAQNGIGYCAKNGALINAVNAIAMGQHIHFMALSGGEVLLSGCSTQYGDYSLYAKGTRSVVTPSAATAVTPDSTAADAIDAANATIVAEAWSALTAGGYTTGWTVTDETYTKADTALLLQCLSWTLRSGDQSPMENFTRGLFNAVGTKVFDSGKEAAFIFSFNDIGDRVKALAGVTGASDTAVTNLIAALVANIETPTTRQQPSKITAIGHTWTAPLAGVAQTKIPPIDAPGFIQDSIVEIGGGVVLATGQSTDDGAAEFSGDVSIDPDYGLQGDGFVAPVRRVAIKTALAGV